MALSFLVICSNSQSTTPPYEGLWIVTAGVVQGENVTLVGCLTLEWVGTAMSGLAACNFYNGNVDIVVDTDIRGPLGTYLDGALQVRDLAWTDIFCGQDLNRLEQIYLQSLLSVNEFTFDGNEDNGGPATLEFSSPTDSWRFERPPPDGRCPSAPTIPPTASPVSLPTNVPSLPPSVAPSEVPSLSPTVPAPAATLAPQMASFSVAPSTAPSTVVPVEPTTELPTPSPMEPDDTFPPTSSALLWVPKSIVITLAAVVVGVVPWVVP